MLGKEEIEFNLKALSGVMLNFEDRLCDEMQERIKEVKEYIEDLESREQKLIEKLEKDIEDYRVEMNNTNIKLNQIHYMKRIEYAKEILEILKKE